MGNQSAIDNSLTQQNYTDKGKIKSIEVAIRLRNEINLCIIPSGKFRDGKYKSPFVLWAKYNLPGAIIPTTDELIAWNNKYHPTLWGFVTGEASGITVFDADDLISINLFHNAGLTPHVITKKGEHYYFTYPGQQHDHLIYTIEGIIPHVDIRSRGGFVNCIGHNSTASYKMVKSPAQLYNVKQLPKEVIERIGKLQEQKQAGQPMIGDGEGELIPDGQQNRWLFRRACGYHHHGDTQEVIFLKIKLDLARCPQTKTIPFTDSTLRRIAKSAARYAIQEKPKSEFRVISGAQL